jgi:adenosylhomocysteine nucleosidase
MTFLSRPLRIGVVAAMQQEMFLLRQRFGALTVESIGPREFVRAEVGRAEVILTMSHIGKVAAATTATLLVDRFGVDAIVFTGVGGGIGQTVSVGDIIVADQLIQHDLDLKGVLGFERFVIPSLGVARVATSEQFASIAREVAQAVISDPQYRSAVERLVGREPMVHVGLIGSGDRFIGSDEDRRSLIEVIPDLLAVEMEGAAVAQVCAEHGVPLVVSRVISDRADSDAHVDFITFVEQAAAIGSERFVIEFLRRLE